MDTDTHSMVLMTPLVLRSLYPTEHDKTHPTESAGWSFGATFRDFAADQLGQ
jgi:hypothetical protein